MPHFALAAFAALLSGHALGAVPAPLEGKTISVYTTAKDVPARLALSATL